jgi:membrane protease YdiL (CAAX protease family)
MLNRFQGLLNPQSSTLQGLLTFSIVFLGSQFFAPQFDSKHVLLHSVLLQIGLVFGIPFAMGRSLKMDTQADFKLKRSSFRNLAFSTLIALSLIGLLEELAFLQSRFLGEVIGQESSILEILKVHTASDFGWMLLAVGLVPAFCEEFLFRGFIFNRLLHPNQIGQAVMLSSVLFGVFHRQLSALLNNTVAGIVLALIVYRSGSLFNSILAHAVINTVAIAIVNSKEVSAFFSVGQKGHLPLFLLAASLAGLVFGLKGLRFEQTAKSVSESI